MSASEIVQIIIASLSLVSSIIVSFLVYWLQKRHEKEISNLEEKRRAVELENEADCFLIDNEDEREYLPYCMVASNIHKLDKHTRAIYTNFCRCSEELQNKILTRAEIELPNLQKNINWVEQCMDLLEADIAKYKLGYSWLYDSAKYFHRGYTEYKGEKWESTPADFEEVYDYNEQEKATMYRNRTNIDIGCYISDYLYYYIDGRIDYGETPPMPPIDYACELENFRATDQKTLCWWIMDIVHQITIVLHNRRFHGLEDQISCYNLSGIYSETFEDEYYSTLLWLYFTYWYPTHKPSVKTSKKHKQLKKH